MSTYALGARSLEELEGVNDDLVLVVKRAIQITPVDFSVHDGLRTQEEQLALVASGASRTMNSKHLVGHAVDLVPYINGKMRWEWEPIYKIADAVREVAREAGVEIRWGGCWCYLNMTEKPTEHLVAEYVERRRAQGKRAFIDGPHYEYVIRGNV